MIRKIGTVVEGINKKGLIVALPETIVKTAQAMVGNFILDGEQIGDVFHAFDALKLDGEDFRAESYRHRLNSLERFMPIGGYDSMRVISTAYTLKGKREMFNLMKAWNREGVVFQQLDAQYLPGKPNKGGSQFKFKFIATLSAIVARINTHGFGIDGNELSGAKSASRMLVNDMDCPLCNSQQRAQPPLILLIPRSQFPPRVGGQFFTSWQRMFLLGVVSSLWLEQRDVASN